MKGKCPYCDQVIVGEFRQHVNERHPNAMSEPDGSWEQFLKMENIFYGRLLQAARASQQAPRRRHSRDGRVRCDLCAPLRCSKAP